MARHEGPTRSGMLHVQVTPVWSMCAVPSAILPLPLHNPAHRCHRVHSTWAHIQPNLGPDHAAVLASRVKKAVVPVAILYLHIYARTPHTRTQTSLQVPLPHLVGNLSEAKKTLAHSFTFSLHVQTMKQSSLCSVPCVNFAEA